MNLTGFPAPPDETPQAAPRCSDPSSSSARTRKCAARSWRASRRPPGVVHLGVNLKSVAPQHVDCDDRVVVLGAVRIDRHPTELRCSGRYRHPHPPRSSTRWSSPSSIRFATCCPASPVPGASPGQPAYTGTYRVSSCSVPGPPSAGSNALGFVQGRPLPFDRARKPQSRFGWAVGMGVEVRVQKNRSGGKALPGLVLPEPRQAAPPPCREVVGRCPCSRARSHSTWR